VVYSLSEQISRVGGDVEVGDLPVVQVSKTHLVQVFDNLIGNAIRYGCKPGDVIEVGGERRGEKVYLYVRDHGPGIPIDERDRIFEVFFRGTISKSQKGSGVGLATVQKIAKIYEGRTWVEETSGGGSTFWVEMVDVPVSGPVK
jgi:signal transduction histidine kinase